MSRKRNSSSLLFVILGAVLVASSVAGVLFLFNFFHDNSPVTSEEFNNVFEQGRPEKVIQALDQLPAQKRGSSESLLWYGKSWYLKAWKEQEENNWQDYGKNSNDWFNNQSIDEAVHFLKRAAADSTTKEEALFYLALISMQKGHYEESQRLFLHLFQINQEHREGLLNYAVLSSRQGDNSKAVQYLLKGIAVYPDEPEFYKNLFWIYLFKLKEYDKAVMYGDQYLKKAEDGARGAIQVRHDMIDLLARFPELANDTLEIEKTKGKTFNPRKKKPFNWR